MTGYGRAAADVRGRSLIVEIRTVNHRYLDVRVRMPAGLLASEDNIRRAIAARLHRGRVECTVAMDEIDVGERRVRLDEGLLASAVAALHHIREALGTDEPVRVTDVLSVPALWTIETDPLDEAALGSALHDVVNEALDDVLRMRRKEGAALLEDIVPRIERVAELADRISEQAPRIVVDLQRRLHQRLEQLLAEHPLDPDRVAQEAAILADRADVAEEIARIHSHLDQFRTELQGQGPVGRTLDFLLQELHREWNTIGAKTQNAEAILHVVQARAEVEKMREQVQNLE